MRVASSCFDSLVRCNVLESLPLSSRGLRSTRDDFLVSMDEPLRSGNRPKPQHWNSDESTEVEGTFADEDQDWNDDSDDDWAIDSEGRSSLSGGRVCALVASDGQASLRRSISETDLLVSEEEVNQTFACWKEGLVGITGLCGPVVDGSNCFWPMCVTMVGTRNSISLRCWSQVSRSLSGRPAKRTGRCSLWHALHCLALYRVVSETCPCLP